MKRFLALVSAVAVCFSSFSFSYADTSTESDVSAQANDLPSGVHLGQYIADVSYAGGGVGPDLPKAGDWVSSTVIGGSGIPPSDPVVNTGYYYIPPINNADYVYVRITFDTAVPADSSQVGWFTFDANFLNSPDQSQVPNFLGGFNLSFPNYQPNGRANSLSPDPLPYRYYLHPSNFGTPSQTSTFYLRFENTSSIPMYLGNFVFSGSMIPEGDIFINPYDGLLYYPSSSWVTELFEDLYYVIDSVKSTVSNQLNQIVMAIKSIFDKSNDNWDTKDYHNSEVDSAISDIEQQDQQMGAVEDKYLGDFNSQQSEMSTTLSTFQWPIDITSGMAWITIQMNTIWSGLGGNIQMLFTFSMILGLGLIFLGRWRA